MVPHGRAHPAPISEHVSKEGGGRRRELAESQGGGEKELTLIEVPVGVVKVLPH